MTKTVLILGASGKIGRHANRAFANAGWNVRAYDRATGNMTKAALGADVIVNGMNPPAYHNWAEILPQTTAQTIAAAKASGATVIIPGNVYNFGATGGTWSQTTPQNPNTRKGQLRKDMELAYRAAGVRTIILRAGNFIDPDSDEDVMGLVILRAVKRGKITHPGRPDAMQTYAYLPDWARAAVALAEMRSELAPFEDIPFPGHAFTLIELQAEILAQTGRSLKPTGFPWLLMRLTAPFWELARELMEMRYLWSLDHRLDNARFDQLLPGFEPTNLKDVVRASLPAEFNPNQTVRPGKLAVSAQ
ncbi:MAG: sugar nucleotide-binding protein [Rhodobacteraceae bacterium]|nr:sugar nucleotide-binding protein [Paracoccaceae bacterium]